MTLEDFFTLTEMKDGLTALARVNELITVMQKEKDYVVKNVGEATRQWSTVASAIAATENKECLDLFVQLDGLWFIDRWLKDAQKFVDDTGNSFVIESITALLRALEKLQIDGEKSILSGIWWTVNSLCGHSNSTVQDKARALLVSWKLIQHNDAAPQDVQKVKVHSDDGIAASANHSRDSGRTEGSSLHISPSCRDDTEENNLEPSRDQSIPLICSDAMQQVGVYEGQVQTRHNAMDNKITQHGHLGPEDSSNMLKVTGGNLLVKEETPICHSEGATAIKPFGPADTVQGTLDQKSDGPQFDQQMQEKSSPEKAGVMDISSVSCPLERRVFSSSSDVAYTVVSALETESKEETDAKEEDSCQKVSPFSELRKFASQGVNGVDGDASPNHCSRSRVVCETKDQDGEPDTDAQESSGDERNWGEAENPKTIFPGIEDDGVVDDAKDHGSSKGGANMEKDSDFSQAAMDSKHRGGMSKRSDVELDYGMVDPLEVARQVAIEVEREVDGREPSCSSSEKSSGGRIGEPNSPDSTNGKESQAIGGPYKEVPSGSNLSAEVPLTGVEPVVNAETLDAERENCIYDMPSPQISEAAQESEVMTDRGLSGFDLNEEIFSEDTDSPINEVSKLVSVVSASRAAAAAGLPAAPLQFEGTLGWKGSAATSAFRRIPEGDKALPMFGANSTSKQRLDSLDFDLNVAEGDEGKIEDLLSEKHNPIPSGLPSGEESSVEASPKRSERLQLDLNCASDGIADGPSDWRRDGRAFQNQNGRLSPSRSSSSSSMQPVLRNIDLNDQPFFLNDSSLDHPYLGKSFQNLNASGGVYKPDESVISILGTRVEIKRKDSVPQTLSLPNGRISESTIDINLARAGGMLRVGSPVPYAHSPVYGYNGFASGHPIPFSAATYGPPGGAISYMVDSRGAPVVPQFMGSTSVHPPAFSQPTPFMMSLTAGTSSGSNGAGSSRHSIDLNSGMMIEGGTRETSGGTRQFLNSSQGRSLEEHLRANSQQPSFTSGLGAKRQEPDSGWEHYPFNFKHHQPPWK